MGEGRRRLVEDEQPGRARQRAGDLHDLALADAQRADGRVRVDVHLELVEDLLARR